MWEGKRDYLGGQLQKVFDAIRDEFFGDVSVIHPILDALATGHDYYIVCHDFYSYVEAQERADKTYRDIRGLDKCGKFSSDRTIAEYCHDVW